ncbi:hypothetical protein [Schaedlerella arabinosiphila]|uniref:hypothetical protein n=1 Tax=Schaedlerella arabinosiphila TaxID=2044587 RepID=UPI0025581B3A|nr:hypothetical protein [Schaedlerella arabinosiphila]
MRGKSIDELVGSIIQSLVDLFSEGIEDLELVEFALYEIFSLDGCSVTSLSAVNDYLMYILDTLREEHETEK